MEMEELTREEAIRRHRLMWNWLADETERTREVVIKRAAFKYFGWPYEEVHSSCWCCECAINLWQEDETDEEKIICDFCPLDWSIGNNIVRATCTSIPYDLEIVGSIPLSDHGLFTLWLVYSNLLKSDCYMPDIDKAVTVARTIANLPEKKEVKEDD